MSAPVMERLAGSRLVSRLPPPLRTRFALNNFIYFGGNFFAGLAGFAFQGLLANALGANGFAEVAPLISLFYLVQIPMFIVMAVAARYSAPLAAQGDQSRVNRGYRDLVLYSSVVGFAGMVVFLLLLPFMKAFLNLPSYGPLVILSAAVPLTLLVGVGRGVVQGEERFFALSSNFFLYGATTVGFLPLLLAFHLRAVGAMLAINLALVLCNLLAAISLRDLPPAGHHERLPIWPLLRGAFGASAGIAAITLFYNFDVLLAKHFLSNQDAGLYSAMSLLGKILFFGTISVSVVMFPRVAAIHAAGQRAHRTVNLSLALVASAGGVVVLAYFLAPTQIVHLLLRKPEYEAIASYLGLFSLAMLGLALSNLLVYYFVAVHKRRFVLGVAVGAVAFGTLLKLHHGDLGQFTSSVTIAIDLMAVALIALYLLERPHLAEEQAPAAAAPG
ncbi:MAG TPA: oligosaccharide flippase family protein [Candidatus Dormibacteraeota bacterium]|nr:oligosaccharide flippase family protein [Candidatus Dormibacteraeota bacterium]